MPENHKLPVPLERTNSHGRLAEVQHNLHQVDSHVLEWRETNLVRTLWESIFDGALTCIRLNGQMARMLT